MKKASIQLSVNFLVVMIICMVLLGIGIKLIGDFSRGAVKMREDVDKYHEEQLKRTLNQGALVSVYPGTLTVNRGDQADFSVGISNELGMAKEFSVYVKEVSTISGAEPQILYYREAFMIDNKDKKYTPIKVIIPNAAGPGTHIFNVHVCKAGVCTETSEEIYGGLQKLHVNVR